MTTTNTMMSDFTILNKLGSGAFSEVYKVTRKSDGKEYALKKVSTTPEPRSTTLFHFGC